MKLKEVRAEMHQLADKHGIPRLHELADETIRRRRAPFGKRAKAVKLTPELKEQVRAFVKANPKMIYREVGAHFGIDGGRVSEIMHGYRQ